MSIFTSTIAAISTPPGKGGVALIRISGDDAHEIAARVFHPRSKKSLASFPMRYAIYGDVYLAGERIDDGLLTLFSAPNSYTGEPVAEICCHGGVLITKTVLEAVLAAGAAPAERGEFTRRAFINGRISLSEAEAVASLLDAKSRAQISLASKDARGRFAEEISALRGLLTSLLSSVYARIDYPDEDLGDFSDAEARDVLAKIRERIERLMRTYRTGKSVNEGIKTVILGKPNAGKSTLYNLISGEELAIVTDVAGTTRDLLEKSVPLGNVLLHLTDTAGIHDSCDEVERIGIERATARLCESELIIAVFDLSRPFDADDERLVNILSKDCSGEIITVLNKSDLCGTCAPFDRKKLGSLADGAIEMSAKTELNTDALCQRVAMLFTDEKINLRDDAVVASARQNSALARAHEYVCSAIAAYDAGLCADVASSDTERALGAIAELDGRAVSDEIVSDIFSRFCVGK